MSVDPDIPDYLSRDNQKTDLITTLGGMNTAESSSDPIKIFSNEKETTPLNVLMSTGEKMDPLVKLITQNQIETKFPFKSDGSGRKGIIISDTTAAANATFWISAICLFIIGGTLFLGMLGWGIPVTVGYVNRIRRLRTACAQVLNVGVIGNVPLACNGHGFVCTGTVAVPACIVG